MAEYDAADHGERGVILSREALYSSHITEWRKAAEAGAATALDPKAKDRRDREIEQLRARAEMAESEFAKTKAALDLVGKAHALLETLSESTDLPRRSQPVINPPVDGLAELAGVKNACEGLGPSSHRSTGPRPSGPHRPTR